MQSTRYNIEGLNERYVDGCMAVTFFGTLAETRIYKHILVWIFNFWIAQRSRQWLFDTIEMLKKISLVASRGMAISDSRHPMISDSRHGVEATCPVGTVDNFGKNDVLAQAAVCHALSLLVQGSVTYTIPWPAWQAWPATRIIRAWFQATWPCQWRHAQVSHRLSQMRTRHSFRLWAGR